NIQDVLVVGACLLEIDAIGVELHGRDAAPHADVEAAAAEMIEHAELFQQPQRVVERQEKEQRAEADAPRFAPGGGQKQAQGRRRPERGWATASWTRASRDARGGDGCRSRQPRPPAARRADPRRSSAASRRARRCNRRCRTSCGVSPALKTDFWPEPTPAISL